jgi:hypothetical protein
MVHSSLLINSDGILPLEWYLRAIVKDAASIAW